MIYMKISVLYNNKHAFYEISNFSYCYSCDDEIAYFLNIKVNEYRERLEKYNVVYRVGVNNEIYLKSDVGRDRLIEIFENEFVVELTLAKKKKKKIKGVCF